MFKIKYKEQLAFGIFQMTISAPRVAKKALSAICGRVCPKETRCEQRWIILNNWACR